MEPSRIKELVGPMLLQPLTHIAYEQLSQYVDLLIRWNSRMNLTAVRDPRILVALHLAECLRCAQSIPAHVTSALDFGSGAGLPGIPIQIARPEIAVTLAESQTKKSAFLREAVRMLGFQRAKVFAGRVESLPPTQKYNLVALRAVDRMQSALDAAENRIQKGGHCMILTSKSESSAVMDHFKHFQWNSDAVPGTEQRIILLGTREV